MAAGDFRDRLLQCLGGEWPKPGPLNAKTLAVEELEGGIRREKITYEAEPDDIVPAYVLVPPAESNVGEGRLSSESPVGRAIRGHCQGEIVDARAPHRIRHLRITDLHL